jgi:hypothetical protein
MHRLFYCSSHSWFYLLFYFVDTIQLCKYLQYVQKSLSTTSLWFMVLLSFERSLAFRRPFTIQRVLQSRTICLVLLLVTCVCFIVHVDEITYVDIKAFRWINFAYGLCSIKRHSLLSTDRIKIVRHAHSFILPFVFNSLLDIYICSRICQRRQRSALKSQILLLTSKSKKKHQRAKKSLAHEITCTLLCQSLWLLLAYFPTHLFYFLLSFKLINDHDRDNSTVNFLLRQSLLIYLAFSPTLYVIFSPTLRKEIYSYLRRTYKRHRMSRLSTKVNREKKFQDVLSRHRFEQQQQQLQLDTSRQIVTVITIAESCSPTRLTSTVTSGLFLSKSAPCLIKHVNSMHLYEYADKIERSITLQEWTIWFLVVNIVQLFVDRQMLKTDRKESIYCTSNVVVLHCSFSSWKTITNRNKIELNRHHWHNYQRMIEVSCRFCS